MVTLRKQTKVRMLDRAIQQAKYLQRKLSSTSKTITRKYIKLCVKKKIPVDNYVIVLSNLVDINNYKHSQLLKKTQQSFLRKKIFDCEQFITINNLNQELKLNYQDNLNKIKSIL
jgi:hypothetical protein